MNTFNVLLKCLPFFGFIGLGLYFLLTALVPAWRDKDWTHWKIYGTDNPRTESSWLVQLGFAKPTKPIAEDFSEKTGAAWLYTGGVLLLAIGLSGIIYIVYQNISH
ncbi:MAG TPA: hypothetical protein VGK22_14200 [Candidatus Angelobacter sp.]|jgi:hypothetical protein